MSFGGKPKATQYIETVTPPTIDNSEKTLSEENARKKRRSLATHFLKQSQSQTATDSAQPKNTLG